MATNQRPLNLMASAESLSPQPTLVVLLLPAGPPPAGFPSHLPARLSAGHNWAGPAAAFPSPGGSGHLSNLTALCRELHHPTMLNVSLLASPAHVARLDGNWVPAHSLARQRAPVTQLAAVFLAPTPQQCQVLAREAYEILQGPNSWLPPPCLGSSPLGTAGQAGVAGGALVDQQLVRVWGGWAACTGDPVG